MKSLKQIVRQFLQRLEQERNPPLTDTDHVAISAGLLQVSEFCFFQVAYADWYGREISTPSLEPIFTRYMFDNVVPHWVRHLTRIVLSRSEEGTLDPRDFNIRPPKCDPEQQTWGWHYIITLALVLGVFLVLISNFEPY
jgi:hypothetical protein